MRLGQLWRLQARVPVPSGVHPVMHYDPKRRRRSQLALVGKHRMPEGRLHARRSRSRWNKNLSDRLKWWPHCPDRDFRLVSLALIAEHLLTQAQHRDRTHQAGPRAAERPPRKLLGKIGDSVAVPRRWCVSIRLLRRSYWPFCLPVRYRNGNRSSSNIKPPFMASLVNGSGPRPSAKARSSMRRPCMIPGRP
jgi:hypothetical protein